MACWFQCWKNLTFSNNSGAIDVKVEGLFWKKNYPLIYWGCLSLLNWIGVLILSPLLKLPPKKMEPWFILWSFFCLWFLFISINLTYNLPWNTAVISGLVLLATSWICNQNYRNRYVGLLVFHLLTFWNPWLIIYIKLAYVFSMCVVLVNIHQNWLSWFHFLILVAGPLNYSNRLHDFSVTMLDIIRMPMQFLSSSRIVRTPPPLQRGGDWLPQIWQ